MARYQLTADSDVLRSLDTGACIPRGSDLWPSEWLTSNAPDPIPPLYLPGTPEHHRAIRDATWEWMASVVHERGYDSIESCCSYVTSTVPRYKSEALAMVAWRDAVSQKLEELVLNPPEGIDTWEDVRALLPQSDAFAWPPKLDLPLDNEQTIQIGE